MNRDVQILLSAYNGEKYLREQLDSFLRLDGFDRVRVLIRDDGSSDSTRAILEEYRERHGFRIIRGENLGVSRSMYELLKASDPDCQLFAISDQDDVWLPHKLVVAESHFSDSEPDVPMLYSAPSVIADADARPFGMSTIPKRPAGFYNAMIENIAPGHTQVMNRALVDRLLLREPEYFYIIDYWIYLVASAFGKVIISDDRTVLHRQHGGNAVGYEPDPFRNFRKRVRRVARSIGQNPIPLQLQEFQKLYGDMLHPDRRADLDSFFSCQNSILSRLRYLLRTPLYRQSRLDTLIFKMMYLTGQYRARKGSRT